ncbi:MAG: hypothetical protein KJ950_14660 [Proteobacteria bacterium]|nr:hypothetical protein [Pseudomonadota bacterium]MBU1689010.1 hypothetical protein [Pseudomonadota bacterium]
MEVRPDLDVNQTMAELVSRKDMRLWEGFPVLLVNGAEDYSFSYDQVLALLGTEEDRRNFHTLVLVSLALYRHYHLAFVWSNQLKKGLAEDDLKLVGELASALARDQSFPVGETLFDSNRLKTMFNRYFEQNAEKARQLKEKHEELSLEFALSRLFSPKQKELFKKKLAGEVLTKTEREYYSRTVRKKVAALANPELHRLAQKLMDY